ncbi:MAG: hypothetical protein J6Q65_01860 [Lentisphaeria bacterium]|nr:hypothetical protein [Lentisphaeria bacterium]
MSRYLHSIRKRKYHKSFYVEEPARIRVGDQVFVIKIGNGPCGLVEEYSVIFEWGETTRGKQIIDCYAELRLNPATLPLLTLEELEDNIPDFDWRTFHWGGVVLNPQQTAVLRRLYDRYLQKKFAVMDKQYSAYYKRKAEQDQCLFSGDIWVKYEMFDPEFDDMDSDNEDEDGHRTDKEK